jgi:hypothetical protein
MGADQPRGEALVGSSLSVSPSTDNVWNSYAVTAIVQSWLSGTKPNDGFVVKPATSRR